MFWRSLQSREVYTKECTWRRRLGGVRQICGWLQYPQRQLGDLSSSAYTETHHSLRIPPTAVGGCIQIQATMLALRPRSRCSFRSYLKNPPTTRRRYSWCEERRLVV